MQPDRCEPPAGADTPGLLGCVLPAGVAWAESFGDPPGGQTFAEEDAAIAHAVPRRQREYRTVRHCARTALGSLGVPPAPILSGPNREPLWPVGIVGSLTHCAGYRGAAVARRGEVASVGIDAEPHGPLPAGVLGQVALVGEATAVARLSAEAPGVHWDRLLFCVKEATYKAWFPLTGRWLGFEDAEVTLRPDRTFESRLLVEGAPVSSFAGRWSVQRDVVVAAIVVT